MQNKGKGEWLDRYRVYETDNFISDVRGDLGGQSKKIQKKLEKYVYPQLRIEPHFGPNIKRLKNYDPAMWRYRIGDYRMFYIIEENEKLVLIVSFKSRGNAYKDK
jgi:mRNA interferase RelE/StbE